LARQQTYRETDKDPSPGETRLGQSPEREQHRNHYKTEIDDQALFVQAIKSDRQQIEADESKTVHKSHARYQAAQSTPHDSPIAAVETIQGAGDPPNPCQNPAIRRWCSSQATRPIPIRTPIRERAICSWRRATPSWNASR